MTFSITQDGVFSHRSGQRAQICERPVELVSYSHLDHTFYLRWPAERYHHMAALPQALLENDDAGLARWAAVNGLPLAAGMERSFGEFLREHAAAVAN